MNKNENTTYKNVKNVWAATNTGFRGELIPLNDYMSTDYIRMHLSDEKKNVSFHLMN